MSSSSSDSDADENLTQNDILDVTNNLPEKSSKRYEKCYQVFMNWKTTNNNTSFSENVLLAYFEELSQKFKSSSLWTFFSMLKSTIFINHQIDISQYSKLLAFLKRKSEGFEGKKAKTFSPSEINKFLNEAPNEEYLSIKIALIFGIVGACRRQELHDLQFKDVEVDESAILVKIPNIKTKIGRSFNITDKYYELCKQYIELRPNPCSNPSFFLNYRKPGRCTEQTMGINKFGSLAKSIATYLKLPNPELYTGHCFRRTSATILGDITVKHGGWKSKTVPEGHIEDSITKPILVSNHILDAIGNNKTNKVNVNVPSTSTDNSGSVPVVNFNNCTIKVIVKPPKNNSEQFIQIDEEETFVDKEVSNTIQFVPANPKLLSQEKRDIPRLYEPESTSTGIQCKQCSCEIDGFRYTCMQCADYELCGACEARGAHALHYVLRVPARRPNAELQALLRCLRDALATARSTSGDLADILLKEEVQDKSIPELEIRQNEVEIKIESIPEGDPLQFDSAPVFPDRLDYCTDDARSTATTLQRGTHHLPVTETVPQNIEPPDTHTPRELLVSRRSDKDMHSLKRPWTEVSASSSHEEFHSVPPETSLIHAKSYIGDNVRVHDPGIMPEPIEQKLIKLSPIHISSNVEDNGSYDFDHSYIPYV